jgi:mono/diheme cytochrome c family protein
MFTGQSRSTSKVTLALIVSLACLAALSAALLTGGSASAAAHFAPPVQAATPTASAQDAPAGGAMGSVITGAGAITSTPPQPPDAVAGRQLYIDHCAACHGTTGKGDGQAAAQLQFKPIALADPQIIGALSPAQLYQTIKNGRMDRMMPPWGGVLTDQQIWDTLGYVWTLHTSADEVNRGKTAYAANCATCHGQDGVGQPPMMSFTSLMATGVVSQTAWAQTLAQGRGKMPAYGDKLDKSTQTAVLEYVRGLSFKQEFPAPLQTGDGVVTGTVTNGTTGKLLPNQNLSLHIFGADGTTVLDSRVATSDAAGAFRFDKLPTDAGLTFGVDTLYPAGSNGVPYGSGPTGFVTGTKTLALPVTVYETTTENTGIHADRVHYIIEFDSGRLLIAELMVFSLDGNRTYLGATDGTGVIHVSIPAAAQDLAMSDGALGGRFLKTADGFADTLPLPPGSGTRQLLFRYALPYTGTTFEMTRTLAYPAAAVNALIADQGEQVTSPQLQSQPARQTPNGNYINLLGQNIGVNQQVLLRFTNLSGVNTASGATSAAAAATGAAPAGSERTLMLIGIGVLGFALVAMVAWPLVRRRGLAARAALDTAGGKTAVIEAPAAQGREALVDALARLDRAHQAGEISDGAYREERLRLKARLADMLRQERGADAD